MRNDPPKSRWYIFRDEPGFDHRKFTVKWQGVDMKLTASMPKRRW